MCPADSAGEAASFGEFLRRGRDAILALWLERAGTLPSAQGLDRTQLLDHFGQLLDAVAGELEGKREGLAPAPGKHALERLATGFELEDVVREYSLLREVVLTLHARERPRVAPTAELGFHRAVDQAVRVAVSRFVNARARTLESLNRISSAALRTDRPEALLEDCVRVLVDTCDAVDTAALFLVESARLRRRVALGAPAGPDVAAAEETFAGAVAKAREPIYLHSAETEAGRDGPLLRRTGLRALYGLPLLEGSTLLGVAQVGSRTAESFSDEDLLVFRQAAARISALLHQRQLRDREHRSAERAERAERDLRALLESISDGFATLDPEGRVTYMNPKGLAMINRTADELFGKILWETIPTTVTLGVRDQLEQVRRTQHPAVFVTQSDITHRWIETRAFPSPFGLSLYFHDVNERHARDEERERLLAKASSAEEILERGDPMVVVDSAYRVQRTNAGFERLFGGAREELTGQCLWTRFPDLGGNETPLWRELQSAMEERRPAHLEYLHEPLGLWTSISAYPTREGGLAVFLRDISERKRSEQFQDRMIGIVGHDLRNPLQAIFMSTRVLTQGQELPDPVVAGLLRIQRSAERMTQIINDLLDFTRAKVGGGIPLQPRRMDLCAVARGLVEELEVAHPGRIRLHCPPTCVGEWDEGRLGQVVSNLLSNALKYGDVRHPVEVTIESDDEDVRLSVTNRGTPIAPDVLPHIFDPFRREGGKRAEGLGLGLYIVEQVVLRHGGAISVDSRDDRTRFLVRLPRTNEG